MTATLQGELVTALRLKLGQLDRMRGHLEFSLGRARPWLPLPTLEGLGPERLETLAALKQRFAELQDQLAAAMRLVARIEEVDTSTFSYVLNHMERIGVIPAIGAWWEVRDLRNAAAHDYGDDPDQQADFFNRVADAAGFLFETLAALGRFCHNTYGPARE